MRCMHKHTYGIHMMTIGIHMYNTQLTNKHRNLMLISTHTHVPHPNNIIIYSCIYHVCIPYAIHMMTIEKHIYDTHIHTRRMNIEIWWRSTLTLIDHTPTTPLYIHVYIIIYTWWKSGNVHVYDRHIHTRRMKIWIELKINNHTPIPHPNNTHPRRQQPKRTRNILYDGPVKFLKSQRYSDSIGYISWQSDFGEVLTNLAHLQHPPRRLWWNFSKVSSIVILHSAFSSKLTFEKCSRW